MNPMHEGQPLANIVCTRQDGNIIAGWVGRFDACIAITNNLIATAIPGCIDALIEHFGLKPVSENSEYTFYFATQNQDKAMVWAMPKKEPTE